MKSSKQSLVSKLTNCNFNYTKNSKWFWIASVVLAVVGIFVTIFAGFNLGTEFTGGSVLSVELGTYAETTEKYNTSVEEITDLLGMYGIHNTTLRKQGELDTTVVIFEFANKSGKTTEQMESLLDEVRTQINLQYNADNFVALGDKFDITINSGVTSASSIKDGLLFNAFVAILFALAILLIYISIRFGMLSGLTTLLGIIVDTVVALALVAICRIPVTTSIFGAVVAVMAISMINSLIVFARIKENLKNPALTDQTNQDIVTMSIKQSFTRVLGTTIIVALFALMFVILGPNSVRAFFAIILFGTISSCYSTIFLMPEFWANVNHKRILVKPQATIEEVEQVEVNNDDAQAEVIEIQDDKK